MRRRLSLACGLVALAVALAVAPGAPRAAGSAVVAAGDGWFEVRSGESAADEAGGGGGTNARAGDGLWMGRAGETLAEIARATTGSAADASAIAAYNALAVDAPLAAERLLYVPAELMPPARTTRAKPEIREFGPARERRDASAGSDASADGGDVRARREGDGRRTDGPARDAPASAATASDEPRRSAAVALRAPTGVARRKLDLFVGEVRVLGEVDVTRVAVGNGAILRAEVLGSGELLVIAQGAGSTSLRLWHSDRSQSDFNVRVAESDPETRVRMERMVRMRVRMVEFRKSALGRLGIDWSDSVNGPSLAAAGDVVGNRLFRPAAEGFDALPRVVEPFSTYFGIASNLSSRINLLAATGDAVTLAEPVLSTTNGGSASFLAGGEVPYPVVGADGLTSVQFKEYGIRLEVVPLIDEAGNVRAAVRTEISQLDPAVSVQGAPGLLTRRAETVVNVRSGQTIVISGLLSAEQSKDIERIPGIGRLPVIGALFRSQSTRRAASELVIFVTPEVVEPPAGLLAEGERALLERSGARLERARATLPILD